VCCSRRLIDGRAEKLDDERQLIRDHALQEPAEEPMSSSELLGAIGLEAIVDNVILDLEYQQSAANDNLRVHTVCGAVRVHF